MQLIEEFVLAKIMLPYKVVRYVFLSGNTAHALPLAVPVGVIM